MTTVDAFAVPPAPLQVNVYVVVAASAPVACVPEVAMVPDHPPEATQEFVSVEFQVNVALPPAAIVAGLPLRLTVGTGVLDTVIVVVALDDPPAPVHVSV